MTSVKRKRWQWLQVVAGLILATGVQQAHSADFRGAVPDPMGKIPRSVSQLRIRFPATMVKSDAIKVKCRPEQKGSSSWADNDTLWTYSFTAPNSWQTPRLVGGASCQVEQVDELRSVDGKVWATGTLSYPIQVSGPNVVQIVPAPGIGDGQVREKDPVVMIIFDGPVDGAQFFATHAGYLSYRSGNAPAEKIALTPVPRGSIHEIFAYIANGQYLPGVSQESDSNWVLATVPRELIPGAEVNLSVSKVPSGLDPGIRSDQAYTAKLQVRSGFRAQVQCSTVDSRDLCLPQNPVSLKFNSKVKWHSASSIYIEYVPAGSADGQVVRTYAQLSPGVEGGYLDSYGRMLPFLKRFSDTIVDDVTFNVPIKPESTARIVVDPGLVDIENHKLTNAENEFQVRIAAMSELIEAPPPVSFFEKNLYGSPNLPVGIVNLNQQIAVRKTGSDEQNWAPIRDVPTIIRMIAAYQQRGEMRDRFEYTSPMERLGVKSTPTYTTLEGERNKGIYLQFPFGKGDDGRVGGFYALEVSSATYELGQSDVQNNRFFNPTYTLAQLTDLTIHMKKGALRTEVWVTSLSSGKPVKGAQFEVYNCLGQQMLSGTTDQNGLAAFVYGRWAESCGGTRVTWGYADPQAFYVVARTNDDFTISHSSWRERRTSPYMAPGVEYVYYDSMPENRNFYHAVIGVNLVKPGQKVPVQVVARFPTSIGLYDIDSKSLPVTARLTSYADEKLVYEFPLKWASSSASFVWQVPDAATAKLGSYNITLVNADGSTSSVSSGGSIDVAEFKVPLMTGAISLPNGALVQPTSIPVVGQIRYANMSGASNLGYNLSYYLTPLYLSFKNYPGFSFANGEPQLKYTGGEEKPRILPDYEHPETISDLKTNASGVVQLDLAKDTFADGQTLLEKLKQDGGPQTLVARLRFQDATGEYQTVSTSKEIYNAPYYLGVKLVSKPVPAVQTVLVDAAGKSTFTDNPNLKMGLYRIAASAIGEQLFGGLIKTTIERELKAVPWQANCQKVQGLLSCELGHLSAGNYVFKAAAGSDITPANVMFSIDNDGRLANQWESDSDDSDRPMALTLDKPVYRAGERAVVKFVPPFKECSAWVTLERSDVVSSFVVDKACEAGAITVPVSGDHAPNVYVSVYAISGRTGPSEMIPKSGELDLNRPSYRVGFANLKVDWARYKAAVSVTTDKPKYQPGETVNVSVAVKPDMDTLVDGKVTLVTLEKKILELKPNDSFAILEAVMQMRQDGVETIGSLDRTQAPVAAAAPSVGFAKGGGRANDARKGGTEGGDGSGSSELRRKLFDALVDFQTDIPVVNGVAQARFKANDNTTNFVVMAVVTSNNQKFGMGQVDYLSQKDTQLIAGIPTLGYTGDSFPLKVTVQNNTGSLQTYRIEVKAEIRDAKGGVLDTKTFTQTRPLNTSSALELEVGQMAVPADASSIRYVTRVYDSSGKLVDSMEPPAQDILPNIPPALHTAYVRQVSGSLSQPLSKEPTALVNKGEIRVNVASSLVAGALEQVRARFASRTFSDFFAEDRMIKALVSGSAEHPEELVKVLTELSTYLDNQGFMKYSRDSRRGSVWLTAEILQLLQTEKWAMAAMPTSLKSSLKAAVSQVLNKSVDPDYIGASPMAWLRAQSKMAVAAFAFGDDAVENLAKDFLGYTLEKLKTNPKAFGPAVHEWETGALVNLWRLQVYGAADEAADSMLYKELTGPARLSYVGNMATINDSPQYRYGWMYEDEIIESAELLAGLTMLPSPSQAHKDLARALALGIVGASDGRWYSGETLGWVAESLRMFDTGTPAVAGTTRVSLPSSQAHLDVDWSQASPTLAVSAPWVGTSETLEVQHSGQGEPWVSVQAFTAVPLKQANSQGLAVEKSIRNLNRDEGFKAGDIIEVTLKLSASAEVAHVAIADPIPAGSNILGRLSGAYGEASYRGYKMYFERLGQGQVTITYQYQVNLPGSYNLPPTRAESLYLPGVYGEVPNAQVVVQ